MSKSFVVNLGRGFELANNDSEPISYESFNTDSDLIIKGYMYAGPTDGVILSGLVIKTEDLKKYLYDVLKETNTDNGFGIDQWNINVDVADGATPEDRHIDIYLSRTNVDVVDSARPEDRHIDIYLSTEEPK